MVMKDDEFEAIVGRIQQEVFAETRKRLRRCRF